MAHKRLSRIGSQNEPKQDAQRWFLASFERCNSGLLDALDKGRPLVKNLTNSGCTAIWSALERHAEWATIAPEHVESSTQYPGACSAHALALHAFMTAWSRSLREPPAWFLACAVSSLRSAALTDSPLRLHLGATTYGPIVQASVQEWKFLGPNADPSDLEQYIRREVDRFRHHLECISEEAVVSATADPEVLHIPKPEGGKPKKSFDWAALIVARHPPEQIADRFTDQVGSDGSPRVDPTGKLKTRAPDVENIRRLSRKVLTHVDWPLTTRTKKHATTPES